MNLQYFVINTNEISAMAVHPLPKRQKDYHEIMWLTNGIAEFIIDGDRYKVNANSFFIFPKGRIHQFIPNKYVEGHVIRFSEELLDTFPRLLFSKFNHISKVSIDAKEIKKFELFFHLFDLELKSSPAPTPIITNLLKSIIYKLDYIRKQQFPSVVSDSLSIDIFDKFQLLMDEYITLHKSTLFYAEKLNITPRKLNDAIKQVMDTSTSSLLSERLSIEAKKMLTYSNKSITEIAYSIGFEDNSYFTKFFKKQTKITPKEFRQNLPIVK